MRSVEEQCADDLADVLDSIEGRGEEPVLYLLSYLHGYLQGISIDQENIPFVMDLGAGGIRVEIIDDMTEYDTGEQARLH